MGTGPRGGEGMTFTELSSEERADPEQFLLAAFFSPTDASQAAGRAYLKRLGGADHRPGPARLAEDGRGATARNSGMGGGAVE